mgnify:CR=1 FL=1
MKIRPEPFPRPKKRSRGRGCAAGPRIGGNPPRNVSAVLSQPVEFYLQAAYLFIKGSGGLFIPLLLRFFGKDKPPVGLQLFLPPAYLLRRNPELMRQLGKCPVLLACLKGDMSFKVRCISFPWLRHPDHSPRHLQFEPMHPAARILQVPQQTAPEQGSGAHEELLIRKPPFRPGYISRTANTKTA